MPKKPIIEETSSEKDKEKRIYEEYLRISSFFENYNDTQFAMLLPLVRNVSFMRVTLDDLAKLINENGAVEEYKNGADQFGMKQSAALQSYNSLVKNYFATVKTLFEKMPREKGIDSQEQWRRSRLSQEDFERALEKDQEDKAKASSEWMEKVKKAYADLYTSKTEG